MEPKNKRPMYDRAYTRFGDNLGNMGKTEPERALDILTWPRGSAYFDAGVLPDVIIKPPKDNAVNKAKTMIPNKQLRDYFYSSIGKREGADDIELDSRLFVNRMWDLYKKSQSPEITALQSGTRAIYKPLSHKIKVDPNYAADDAIAELSHAYQFRGTDTPRTWTWMKQFLSRPDGDMLISGRSGYDTPGSLEYNAHSIIEPRFQMYVSDPRTTYDFIYKSIQDAYNRKPRFVTRGPKINTYIP